MFLIFLFNKTRKKLNKSDVNIKVKIAVNLCGVDENELITRTSRAKVIRGSTGDYVELVWISDFISIIIGTYRYIDLNLTDIVMFYL